MRRLAGPGEPGSGEPIHSGFQTPGRVPGDRAGRWEASPPTTPAPPRGSLGRLREGSPEPRGGPLARLWADGPLLPSPAPPCRRPAPLLQSGFCGARRPAPRLRAPLGGWLRARRGWRCAPPRLHCCAPGTQGSHAPRAPGSRPPGGSAVRWHGPRGRPGLRLWAEALKAALSSAGPCARPARPPAAMAVRPGLWPALLGIVLSSWLRGSGESRARSGETCGGLCARTLAALGVPDPRCWTRLGAPRGQTLRGGTRGPPLAAAQLLRELPRKPGFCQVQKQLSARGAGECRRPTPPGGGSLLVARPQNRVRGLDQRPGSLTLWVSRLEGSDHIPNAQEIEEGVKIPLPGSVCPKELLTIPSLAPGLCPRPEHSVLLCPRHTLAHAHTQA